MSNKSGVSSSCALFARRAQENPVLDQARIADILDRNLNASSDTLRVGQGMIQLLWSRGYTDENRDLFNDPVNDGELFFVLLRTYTVMCLVDDDDEPLTNRVNGIFDDLPNRIGDVIATPVEFGILTGELSIE